MAGKSSTRKGTKQPSTAGEGNASYRGYEYQILVTVWVALDLMLAKAATESVVIEPRSQEDVEAELMIGNDEASVGIEAASDCYDLVLQAKSRSTDPWSAKAIADILHGKPKSSDHGRSGPVPRVRPLHMLSTDAHKRYVFVTNESLQASLRPHQVDQLLEWPESEVLPPYTRHKIDAVKAALIAPRIALCASITTETLEGRIGRLLTLLGHIPAANQPDSLQDLQAEVRRRLLGHECGRWLKVELLDTLAAHGGSILPTRAMDHYVPPKSFPDIRRALDEHHAVIIAGPSGTGKTLTADVLEHALRGSCTPYTVIGGEQGPGYVRAHLMQPGPFLFHLRDPWGGNRLAPDAGRWSNELPKLLSQASPNYKFLVTSRSDVLAGAAVEKELGPYTVTIEIEDYDNARLGEIYDRMCQGLSDHARHTAQAYRRRALAALRRPYELDRFLVALGNVDSVTPLRCDDLIAESQIDAISRVVAAQVAAWSDDGVPCAGIVWGLLSARDTVGANVFPRVRRHLRALEPDLRPEVESFIDFLVAGRNLRRDGNALAFYHPRVEDGLRIALETHRADAEHALGRLCDALIALDAPGGDWGAETALGVRRAAAKLEGMELPLMPVTRQGLDLFLEGVATAVEVRRGFEHALQDLARFGSDEHLPSRLARLLVVGGPQKYSWMKDTWQPPTVTDADVAALRTHALTPALIDRFVREVLPYTRTYYAGDIVRLLLCLSPDVQSVFLDAAETVAQMGGPASNIDNIVDGACSGEEPPYEWLIDLVAAAEEKVDTWFNAFQRDYRRAEEHEVDAAQADHIFEEPGEHYYNAHKGMKALVQLRRNRCGFNWIPPHPHRRHLLWIWADVVRQTRQPVNPDELRALIGTVEDGTRGEAWLAAAEHWDESLLDLLAADLMRGGFAADHVRHSLLKPLSASASEEEWFAILVQLASEATPDRRLELVLDLAMARLNDHTNDAAQEVSACHRRARHLADTFEGDLRELAFALIDVFQERELREVAAGLSTSVLATLESILAKASVALAAPLVCIAGAAGSDPIPVAQRLLAEDNEDAGRKAVMALAVADAPACRGELHKALGHGRWRVRRDALHYLAPQACDSERELLVTTACDRSADVRLAFTELMAELMWPEAFNALVVLLEDARDFDSDMAYASGKTWPSYRVARAAAKTMGAYDALPEPTLSALLKAASNYGTKDPFVTCAALRALAEKDDPRIVPTLLAALSERRRADSLRLKLFAHAAGWTLVDRAAAGRLTFGPEHHTTLIAASSDQNPPIAAPVLIAIGFAGPPSLRESLLRRLNKAGYGSRVELLLVASVAAGYECLEVSASARDRIARLLASRDGNAAYTDEDLAIWSMALDFDKDVESVTAWLLKITFNLPVRNSEFDPRVYPLPQRIPIITMRSLIPFREEFFEPDEGL